jgi:phosphoglucosamine mutase
MRIALDNANGATYRVAPAVFAQTGAEVLSYFDKPDGQNINDGCGATAPEALQQLVVDNKADAGFAFDGDGDRVIVIDERGRAHNGDFVLALAARHFVRHGQLDPKVVVGTVMTNGGLESMLARDGVRLERTQVGDRYVWEAMERLGAQFGGETSGHVIFREYSTTGDGILTALEVLHLARAEGRTLAQLADDMTFWPQFTRNVKAARRREWEANDAFRAAKQSAETKLGSTGRLLVRPSGTEPVLRITVEAQNSTVASSTADELARVAAKELV